MFYAVPLESKPSWGRPPWATILLIVLNLLVYWGPQSREQAALERAAGFYARTVLPALELPAFVAWMQDAHPRQAVQARAMLQVKAYGPLSILMAQHPEFVARLHQGRVVDPSRADYPDWQIDRAAYERLLPEPFTQRWSMDYRTDAGWRPETWLTSAFLHASAAHLLGNMLFLFLFGFSVELALGSWRYIAFYLIGAVGASWLAAWAYAGQDGYGLGASGAVSALMGMYAVLYRLRRIRFFYQIFFYFNYATAPALILLPAWMANEVLQHLFSHQPVAYMAHLGGQITGALLMTLACWLGWASTPLPQGDGAEPDLAERKVREAQALMASMQFDTALQAWREAAALQPQEASVVKAWFQVAKLWPASEDFHRSARWVFRLKATDDATLALQHALYKEYLDLAKPGARLGPDLMAGLVRRFVRAGEMEDADRLCQALKSHVPAHPQLADALRLCITGWLKSGRPNRAEVWREALHRLAPDDPLLQRI